MKNKIILSTLAIAILSSIWSTQVVLAKPGPQNVGPTCSEMLVPFNPEGNTKNAKPASEYSKRFTEDECKSHTEAYPGQHKDITSDQETSIYTLPPINYTDNEITHIAEHFHFYVNTSIEDDDAAYKSYIAAFKISLNNDTLKNAQLGPEDLYCPTWNGQPGDINSPNSIIGKFSRCTDGAYDPSIYGGTKIKRVSHDNITDIIWYFGTDDASKRPFKYGQNTPTTDDVFKTSTQPSVISNTKTDVINKDTAYDNDRRMEMYVFFKSADKRPTTIWTGTTTSSALIRDFYIAHNNINQIKKDNPQNGSYWKSIEPNDPIFYRNNINYKTEAVKNAKENKDTNYYWVNIGTVSTIWKPLKTQTTTGCQDLTITGTPTFKGNTLNKGTAYTFEVTPKFNTIPYALKYNWTAEADNTSSADKPSNSGNKWNSNNSINNKINNSINNTVKNSLQKSLQDSVLTADDTKSLDLSTTKSLPSSKGNTWTGNDQNSSKPGNSGNNWKDNSGNLGDINDLGDLGKTPKLPTTVDNTYGLFKDRSAIPSLGSNPYTDKDQSTYYTGGPAGTKITVQAINAKTGAIEGACKKTLVIPPDQRQLLTCSKFTVTPNYLTLGVQNYGVNVEYSNGKTYQTTVEWQGSGTLTGNKEVTQSNDKLFNFTYAPASSDTVTVQAKDINDPNYQPDPTSCKTQMTIGGGGGGGSSCSKHVTYNDNGFCFEAYPSQYNDQIKWQIDGLSNKDYDINYNNNCIDYTPDDNFNIKVYVPGNELNCSYTESDNDKDHHPHHGGGGNDKKPEFSKRVQQLTPSQSSGYVQTTTLKYDDNKSVTVQYKLVFKSNSNNTNATIIDSDMANGIKGTLLPANNASQYNPGTLTYNNWSTNISGIDRCPSSNKKSSNKTKNNCYQGDDISNGIKLYNLNKNETVTITYQATVKDSPIMNPDICKQGKICEEIYTNHAHANWDIDNSHDKDNYGTIDDWAKLQIFCQYIMSRAAGDIFLENDLSAGVDIQMCSKYKNVTGIDVTPGKPKDSKTPNSGGTESTVFTISHEACSKGEKISGTDSAYGNDVIKNLSSQICEIKLRTGNAWKQSVITNSIEENKTRIARWEALPQQFSLNNLLTQHPDESVIRIKGGLTVDSPVTFPKGAKTFIVEDGDLTINEDITYNNASTSTVKDIPSVAFIVLNGNIKISKNVKTLSGVYYVQEGAKSGKEAKSGTGKLLSSDGKTNTNTLTIYGQVYGDIDQLLLSRQAAGDPSKDEASINVRYDQRIILNTPPGLKDIIDLSQTQVAN